MNERDIQIHNFEGWLARAEQQILQRGGIDQSFIAGYALKHKLPASRIDILVVKGPPSETSLNDEGDEYDDAFALRVIFTLSTKREQTQLNLPNGVKNLHELWAAKLRAMHAFKENPYGGLLPFYTVTQIQEGQNDRDLDMTFWLDYTRIPFDLRVGINSDAWHIDLPART